MSLKRNRPRLAQARGSARMRNRNLRDKTEGPVSGRSHRIRRGTNPERRNLRIVQERDSDPSKAEESVKEENAGDGYSLGGFAGISKKEWKQEEADPLAGSGEHQQPPTTNSLDEDDGEQGEKEVLSSIDAG